MAAALACNPSVITGIDEQPVDILVPPGSPANSAQTAGQPISATQAPVQAPSTTQPLVDLQNLPSIQQMVDELRNSGILKAQTTLAPTTAPSQPNEVQIFPTPEAAPDPTQSILLANTAPTYQRPTAAHLLAEVAPQSSSSPLKWLIPVSFLCLLGVAGIMMYIQMRSTGAVQLPQFLQL